MKEKQAFCNVKQAYLYVGKEVFLLASTESQAAFLSTSTEQHNSEHVSTFLRE